MDHWGQGTCTLSVSRLYRRAIGIPFTGQRRIGPLHPPVEGLVQKQVGQQGTEYSPYEVANFFLQGRDPWDVGRPERPQ
jgi:hypothetical protein